MVRTIWKTLAVGAFALLLSPGASAHGHQPEGASRPSIAANLAAPQSTQYQHDTTQSRTTRRGSDLDTTRMDQDSKSRKSDMDNKSMHKSSKKSKKTSKKSSEMKSGDRQRRGSMDATTSDTLRTQRRGTGGLLDDTSSVDDRNRPDYPSGKSGGTVIQLDSTRRRGNMSDSSQLMEDRNNSATMDTVMGPQNDTSRVNRRGGSDSTMQNRQWQSSDSLNRRGGSPGFDTSSSRQGGIYHRGTLDTSGSEDMQNRGWDTDTSGLQQDTNRQRTYRRGGMRDTASSPEMNNPEINRSKPDMNRSGDGMRDDSPLAPPEQIDRTDTNRRSGSMGQGKDRDQHQDQSGTTRRGSMNTTSEFKGSFKAQLVNADTKSKKGEATVRVNVSGLKMVEPAEMNEQPRSGEGHIHYQLDDGPEIATTSTKLSFHKLSPGDHTIKVMLAGNDHSPLGPQETLKITVPQDAHHGQH